VRGDTYYIATGSYSRYDFNTPESGTTPITIKKAVAADHCTDTGFRTSFGTGQSAWTTNDGHCIWCFTHNGYWKLDGNGRTSRKSGHGFKLDNTNLSTATRDDLYMFGTGSTPINNVTLRYIEIQGAGLSSNAGHGGPLNFSEHTVNLAGITNNITFEFDYIHDTSNIPVQ